MTKSDLKTGMIVKTRCGNYYRVFLDSITNASYCGNIKDRLVQIEPNYGASWIDLDFVDDDLIYNSSLNSDYTIVEVLVSQISCDLVKNHSLDAKVIWKREEVREMTMTELEEVLGYKVKIVKEHTN